MLSIHPRAALALSSPCSPRAPARLAGEASAGDPRRDGGFAIPPWCSSPVPARHVGARHLLGGDHLSDTCPPRCCPPRRRQEPFPTTCTASSAPTRRRTDAGRAGAHSSPSPPPSTRNPDYDPNAPFTADLGVVKASRLSRWTPLAVNRTPLDALHAGQPARINGYGRGRQFNDTKKPGDHGGRRARPGRHHHGGRPGVAELRRRLGRSGAGEDGRGGGDRRRRLVHRHLGMHGAGALPPSGSVYGLPRSLCSTPGRGRGDRRLRAAAGGCRRGREHDHHDDHDHDDPAAGRIVERGRVRHRDGEPAEPWCGCSAGARPRRHVPEAADEAARAMVTVVFAAAGERAEIAVEVTAGRRSSTSATSSTRRSRSRAGTAAICATCRVEVLCRDGAARSGARRSGGASSAGLGAESPAARLPAVWGTGTGSSGTTLGELKSGPGSGGQLFSWGARGVLPERGLKRSLPERDRAFRSGGLAPSVVGSSFAHRGCAKSARERVGWPARAYMAAAITWTASSPSTLRDGRAQDLPGVAVDHDLDEPAAPARPARPTRVMALADEHLAARGLRLRVYAHAAERRVDEEPVDGEPVGHLRRVSLSSRSSGRRSRRCTR